MSSSARATAGPVSGFCSLYPPGSIPNTNYIGNNDVNAGGDQRAEQEVMRLAVIIGVLALATSTAWPQATNVIQRANFVLKGTKQTASGVMSVRIGNKDLIAALNATGDYNFGRGAALFLVAINDQPSRIVVREVNGKQVADTDVSPYMGVREIGSEVHSRNGLTRWATWYFAFDNADTNGETGFQLWGSTIVKRGPVRGRGMGTLTGVSRVQSNVRGVGRVQGAVTVFSGTVSGSSASLVME